MTAKKNEVDTDVEVKEVFEAWLEQQGGKEELVSRVRGEKLTKLILGAKWDMTLAELEEKAGEAGLLEGLRGLTLAKLKEILTPESKHLAIDLAQPPPTSCGRAAGLCGEVAHDQRQGRAGG